MCVEVWPNHTSHRSSRAHVNAFDNAGRGVRGISHLQTLVVGAAALAAIGSGASTTAQAQDIPAASALYAAATAADVSLNVTTVYDSNSAQTSPALAAQEHVALGEAIILPSASINFAHPIGAESVFLQGSFGYDFHLRDYFLNRERINVAGGGTLNFGQCQVAPTLGYNRQQTELQDLAQPFTRNVTSLQSYQVAFNCTRTTGFSPTLTASYLTDTNSTEDASDFRVYTVSGGLAYDQPVLGRLVAFGQYQNVAFTNRDILLLNQSNIEDGYDLASAGLRILHTTGSRISLEAQVAYTEVDENLPGAPGFHGPTYQGQGRYTLSPQLAFDVSFQKAIQPSNYPGVTFVDDQVERLDGVYTFLDRGSFTVGGSTEDRDYEGLSGFSSFLTHERRNVIFTNVGWRFGQHLILDLNTRYERRIAQPAIYTWSGERTGLTLSATF